MACGAFIMLFRDRVDAGQQLAALLGAYANRIDVIVLALPRGGVPVGAQVALALSVPLHVFLVRKLGVPGREELAMGAIASGGVRVLNEDVIDTMGISSDQIEAVAEFEAAELIRREQLYREGRAPLQLTDKIVILVDDGLATGSTMLAAVSAVRKLDPARVVVAVPVGAPDTCVTLGKAADEVICAEMPARFGGVGQWYDDFSQTNDSEVREWLAHCAEQGAA